MFAALVGVLAAVGAASAQAPAPLPIPQQLPNATARLQAIAPPAYPAGSPVTPVGGQVYVKGSGGCSSCGSASSSNAPFGCYQPGCNNGCGSLKADCGFMFGSCKSFFDPCGPGLGGGHGRGHGSRCGTFPFGTPYGHGYNGCVYDTYLNH
jgi:hypothetical protein